MSQQAFDRKTLHALLSEVATELEQQQATAKLYIVGGSAIALGFDEARLTHDVDARIEGDHGKVINAIRTVGQRHGLPSTWVNEQATVYMPTKPDSNAIPVFYHPHLQVRAASREHLIAMKLTAGRPADLEDAQHLIEQSRAPLTVGRIQNVILSLYGPDALTPIVESNISTLDLPNKTIDPPSRGLQP